MHYGGEKKCGDKLATFGTGKTGIMIDLAILQIIFKIMPFLVCPFEQKCLALVFSETHTNKQTDRTLSDKENYYYYWLTFTN